jgi:hypothetical protein
MSAAGVGTPTNGAAMAATLAAGFGALAIGLFVILNEAGIYGAPSLYGPAGGVSGRTTFGVAVWLIAWGALHWRWKERSVDAGRVVTACLVLVGVGLLLTFPPMWDVF